MTVCSNPQNSQIGTVHNTIQWKNVQGELRFVVVVITILELSNDEA